MSVSSSTAGRRYGGADPEERRARRRAALIEAGLEIFGTDGYATASVKNICALAGLTQRYFYESFGDRAELLEAVYLDSVDFVRSATVAAAAEFLTPGPEDRTTAIRSDPDRSDSEYGTSSPEMKGIAAEHVPSAARATLGAFMTCLAQDRRRARVMLVEVVGVSGKLERVRMHAIHGWAELILNLARGTMTPSRGQRLTSVALVGAVTQLLVDWYIAGEEPGEEPAPPSHDPPDRDLNSGDLNSGNDIDDILDVSVDLLIASHARLVT